MFENIDFPFQLFFYDLIKNEYLFPDVEGKSQSKMTTTTSQGFQDKIPPDT